MFDTCPTLDDNVCPDCISGTPGCAAGDEEILYMVVGGYNDDFGGYLSDVELVSLDPDNNPVPPCLTNLNDFPLGFAYAAGSVDEDGLPFICGGYNYPDYFDTCYGYMPTSDSWEEIGTMPSRRGFSAYTFMDGFGLVMAGGYDGSSYLNSVILTKDGSTFETLDSLPTASDRGCLTVVDETTLLLTGGYDSYGNLDQALSYDIPTDTWTSVEDMQATRESHGCGTIDGSGSKEVVVAGDYYISDDDSVELYSFAEETWRTGNSLPYGIGGAASVPYNDSFILVGGGDYDTGEYLDTIIKYVPEDDSWLEMPAKLQTPKAYHTVIPVKQSIFNAC